MGRIIMAVNLFCYALAYVTHDVCGNADRDYSPDYSHMVSPPPIVEWMPPPCLRYVMGGLAAAPAGVG